MEQKLRLARVLSFGARAPSDVEFSWNGVELKRGIYELAKSLSNVNNTLSTHQTIDNWIMKRGSELDGHVARIALSAEPRALDKRVVRMYKELNWRCNKKAQPAPKRPKPPPVSTYQRKHLPMLRKRVQTYEQIIQDQEQKIKAMEKEIENLDKVVERKKSQKGKYKTQDLELDEHGYKQSYDGPFSASLDFD